MSKIHYLTSEGLEKLKAEFQQLISVERPSISKQIAEAREKQGIKEIFRKMQNTMLQKKLRAFLSLRFQSSKT